LRAGWGLSIEPYAIETGEGDAPSPREPPPPVAISTTVHYKGLIRRFGFTFAMLDNETVRLSSNKSKIETRPEKI